MGQKSGSSILFCTSWIYKVWYKAQDMCARRNVPWYSPIHPQFNQLYHIEYESWGVVKLNQINKILNRGNCSNGRIFPWENGSYRRDYIGVEQIPDPEILGFAQIIAYFHQKIIHLLLNRRDYIGVEQIPTHLICKKRLHAAVPVVSFSPREGSKW